MISSFTCWTHQQKDHLLKHSGEIQLKFWSKRLDQNCTDGGNSNLKTRHWDSSAIIYPIGRNSMSLEFGVRGNWEVAGRRRCLLQFCRFHSVRNHSSELGCLPLEMAIQRTHSTQSQYHCKHSRRNGSGSTSTADKRFSLFLNSRENFAEQSNIESPQRFMAETSGDIRQLSKTVCPRVYNKTTKSNDVLRYYQEGEIRLIIIQTYSCCKYWSKLENNPLHS